MLWRTLQANSSAQVRSVHPPCLLIKMQALETLLLVNLQTLTTRASLDAQVSQRIPSINGQCRHHFGVYLAEEVQQDHNHQQGKWCPGRSTLSHISASITVCQVSQRPSCLRKT